jgi:hypothetical protein
LFGFTLLMPGLHFTNGNVLLARGRVNRAADLCSSPLIVEKRALSRVQEIHPSRDFGFETDNLAFVIVMLASLSELTPCSATAGSAGDERGADCTGGVQNVESKEWAVKWSL